MNIGIVLPGFSASEDDWCIPVYLDLVRMLAQEYHQNVRVFPIRYPYKRTPYTVYQAQVFPTGGGSYTRGWWRWSMLRRTQRLIEAQHARQPFDVLHAIWADETGALVNRIGERLGIPTVVSIAGGELVGYDDIRYGLQLGYISRKLVQYALLHATRIVAPCDYTYKLAINCLPSDRHKRVQIAPLGVDTTLFRPPPEHAIRTHDYLNVASLNPIKDQVTLLKLMAQLPTATLDIVGDGPLRPQLEALARSLGIAERVYFHGSVPHHELPHFYQRSRFLVMTSRHEAFCMAAIEALACGAGVVGTAVGVLPEVGLTAPVGDVQALQRAIISRPRKKGYVQRGRFRLMAEHVYSLKQMTEGLLSVYESVREKQL